MFSPYKPPLRPLSVIVRDYVATSAYRRFTGSAGPMISMNPLNYAGGDVAPLFAVQDAARFAESQRVSGTNALLLRDPSMIL
jgi:hypothetical protein